MSTCPRAHVPHDPHRSGQNSPQSQSFYFNWSLFQKMFFLMRSRSDTKCCDADYILSHGQTWSHGLWLSDICVCCVFWGGNVNNNSPAFELLQLSVVQHASHVFVHLLQTDSNTFCRDPSCCQVWAGRDFGSHTAGVTTHFALHEPMFHTQISPQSANLLLFILLRLMLLISSS